jgi:hypothetical protein
MLITKTTTTTNTANWCARALLVLVAMGFAASAQAAPIDYTITFTQLEGGGPLPSGGTFTYDADAPQITDFHVFWNGMDFDMTAAANAPGDVGSCSGTLSGAALGFAILSGTTGCLHEQLWAGTRVSQIALFFLFASQSPVSDIGSMGTTQRIVKQVVHGTGVGGPDAYGTFTIAPASSVVPEPTSMVLLGTGLAGLVVRARRKKA